jgi:hypothetical protein
MMSIAVTLALAALLFDLPRYSPDHAAKLVVAKPGNGAMDTAAAHRNAVNVALR